MRHRIYGKAESNLNILLPHPAPLLPAYVCLRREGIALASIPMKIAVLSGRHILSGLLIVCLLFAIVVTFESCRTKVNVSFGEGKSIKQGLKESRPKAEGLFERIEDGSAVHDFNPRYFNTDTTIQLLSALRRTCDLLNRKGGFVGDIQTQAKNVGPVNILVYEYYLRCDSLRFVLTYKLEAPVELIAFKIEGKEKKNSIVQRIIARRNKE